MIDQNQGKILIVDDDPYTLEMISTILERKGYETKGVDRGQKALDILNSKNPDLLLLDINLPDINGFEICKKVQNLEEEKRIPVIFITGDSSRQNIQKSFEAGGADYVSKPFVIEEVLARIGMAIDNARVKKALENVNRKLEQQVDLQTRRLNLLFSITKLATESLSLEQILQKVVFVLDEYFNHFNLISEIKYRDKVFSRDDVQKYERLVESKLIIKNNIVGKIVLHAKGKGTKANQAESEDLLEAVTNEVNKIIKQKESEEKVKTQWKYYRALKDNSPEGIVTLDQDRKVVDVNPAFIKIFGYSLDTLKHQKLHDFILPQRLAGKGNEIIEKIKNGKNIFTNSVRKTAKGKEIHCSVIGAPINIDSQHMDYFLIYRNIDREKKLELQLMQANKMEAIGQLAAGIAHEINTPTQYVNSNIEFFKDNIPRLINLMDEYNQFYPYLKENIDNTQIESLKDKAENVDLEFLKNEINSALSDSIEGLNKISNIVDAMRTFSHPGNDEKQEININSIIEKTITVSRNEWKYDAILKTNLEKNPTPIPVYQQQISQVILNLIVNATHAIQDKIQKTGEAKGIIKIESLSRMEYLVIKVSDNGCGIPEDIRDKVFNPFFTTKEVGQGTGQGLSMAYNVIVENHDGNIYFETESGKGTTFIIELPIKGI